MDLGSIDRRREYAFESRPGHHLNQVARRLSSLCCV
jgi:hypothetical protein